MNEADGNQICSGRVGVPLKKVAEGCHRDALVRNRSAFGRSSHVSAPMDTGLSVQVPQVVPPGKQSGVGLGGWNGAWASCRNAVEFVKHPCGVITRFGQLTRLVEARLRVRQSGRVSFGLSWRRIVLRNDRPQTRIASRFRSSGEFTKHEERFLYTAGVEARNDHSTACRAHETASWLADLETASWLFGLRRARYVLIALICLVSLLPQKALSFLPDTTTDSFSISFNRSKFVERGVFRSNEVRLESAIAAKGTGTLAEIVVMKWLSQRAEVGARDLKDRGQQEHKVKRYKDGSIYWDYLWFYRPANLYEMIENRDASVCEPIFASLNEKMQWEQTALIHPLMWSRYIVDPWDERQFMWYHTAEKAVRKTQWDAAFVDLDNDGEYEALFRTRNTTNGVNYHSVFLVDGPENALIEQDPLEESYAKSIFESHRVDLSEFEDETYTSSKHRVEILRVSRQNYILISRAFYWTLPSSPKKNRVQVLRLHDGSLEPVCILQAKHEIRLHK